MDKNSKIFVAGHRGLVGSSLIRKLNSKGYSNIVTRSHHDLDLTCQQCTKYFFECERPEYVFLAAAKVGGIGANYNHPADFIYENLMIECNVIRAAYDSGVKKLLYLGSSCIYPRDCPQPIKEEYLLSGALESTNEAYALAKISGLKMCQYFNRQYGTNYISVMPANLYGPNDNFNLENSHVIPALIRKLHDGKGKGAVQVEIWGSGKPLREFLHVDDMADACVFLMENYNGSEFFNLGTGKEISIKDLAEIISRAVEFYGELCFNPEKPDGTPRKLLDTTKLANLGWRYKIELEEGIKNTYNWFLEAYPELAENRL